MPYTLVSFNDFTVDHVGRMIRIVERDDEHEVSAVSGLVHAVGYRLQPDGETVALGLEIDTANEGMVTRTFDPGARVIEFAVQIAG